MVRSTFQHKSWLATGLIGLAAITCVNGAAVNLQARDGEDENTV